MVLAKSSAPNVKLDDKFYKLVDKMEVCGPAQAPIIPLCRPLPPTHTCVRRLCGVSTVHIRSDNLDHFRSTFSSVG